MEPSGSAQPTRVGTRSRRVLDVRRCACLCLAAVAMVAGGLFSGDASAVSGSDPITSVATGPLNRPWSVATDPAGNLYFTDTFNHRVRKMTPAGTVITIAGIGAPGFSGDGGPATAARLYNPSEVALDSAGNVFIADYDNYRVRRVDASTGTITTVAGTGAAGSSGNGGPATAATLGRPTGLASDASGTSLSRNKRIFG